MADNKDALEARRWFRRRLTELGRQYPYLKHPQSQERLTEEDMACHENPQETPEDAPKGQANSIHPTA
jgi:hypothetical protein